MPSIQIVGTLRIARVYLDQREEVVFEKSNLLVNQGLKVFPCMIGGGAGIPPLGFNTLSDLAVTRMEIGNNAAPPAPLAGDVAPPVQTFIYAPPLVVDYPTAYSVRFTGTIPATECNGATPLVGQNLTEEALVTANGLLFAKRTFVQLKNSTFALTLAHTFDFTIV
jgi:hypothetical protein